MAGLGFLLGFDDGGSRDIILQNQRNVGNELARQGSFAVSQATARSNVNPVAAARMNFEAQRQARNTAAAQAQQALLQQRNLDRQVATNTLATGIDVGGAILSTLLPGAQPAMAAASPLVGAMGSSMAGGALPGKGTGQPAPQPSGGILGTLLGSMGGGLGSALTQPQAAQNGTLQRPGTLGNLMPPQGAGQALGNPAVQSQGNMGQALTSPWGQQQQALAPAGRGPAVPFQAGTPNPPPNNPTQTQFPVMGGPDFEQQLLRALLPMAGR